jgi:hypothetical protein
MGGATIIPHSLKTHSHSCVPLKIHKNENFLAPILIFVLFHLLVMLKY